MSIETAIRNMTEAERERFYELAGKLGEIMPQTEADWKAAAKVIDERKRGNDEQA